MKELIRFLLAPLPASIAAACISVATGAYPWPLSIVMLVCLLLYAAQLVFGFPICLLLIRQARHSAASLAIGGFAMTAIPAAPYAIWGMAEHGQTLTSAAVFFWLMGCYGALTGFTYWLLVRGELRRRA